jgi:F1F0 ATPase subunit 2
MTHALALVLGGALGVAYFGGLWLTVRRLADRRRPRLLLVGSWGARLVLVAAGFAALAAWGTWTHLVAALAGFVAARTLMVACLRPSPGAAAPPADPTPPGPPWS